MTDLGGVSYGAVAGGAHARVGRRDGVGRREVLLVGRPHRREALVLDEAQEVQEGLAAGKGGEGGGGGRRGTGEREGGGKGGKGGGGALSLVR